MTLRLFRITPLLAGLGLALAPLGLAAPATAQNRAATTDWTKTVTMTPKGAFILGNPNARTKLVEYMSYSCPHCADFAKQATAELKAGWIKSGALSIEYRNFVRDPYDLSAALIARCGGAQHFLANHEQIFASFDQWVEKAQAYASRADDAPKDRTAMLVDIAQKVGFVAVAQRNGLSAEAARKCVSDPAALDTLLAMTSGASEEAPGFSGTPTFLMDGKMLANVHSWQALKPLLPALPASGK